MGRYEELLIENKHLPIGDSFVLDGKFDGIYDNGVILIDKTLSNARKLEVLAEELAHHKLTAGDITDQEIFNNRKFENYARRYSMELIISLDGIISACLHGVHNLYEMAEYFEVTEEYIKYTLRHYKAKYGISTYHKGYVIKFEPLQVFKHIEFN
ncbi:ImmA/IrrE family metallo-endopeptidase [Mammaliicoccus sciuri]|uniref:ImmA/IrrE family metallo-endopeptidase n=1 Tax=Mammaliicoccus sciuri TaxID=1296 RepID=UPI000A0322F3|nr:ImmA/IrrE family metallo-endopeptidase [Mammaliicoccus sciuri]ORI05563.1 toxin [Mammaliicoccus sciuri]PCM42023.1 ImmA/IrrE family metallo-endopeptidase [Mammaliicoccus sciuri]